MSFSKPIPVKSSFGSLSNFKKTCLSQSTSSSSFSSSLMKKEKKQKYVDSNIDFEKETESNKLKFHERKKKNIYDDLQFSNFDNDYHENYKIHNDKNDLQNSYTYEDPYLNDENFQDEDEDEDEDDDVNDDDDDDNTTFENDGNQYESSSQINSHFENIQNFDIGLSSDLSSKSTLNQTSFPVPSTQQEQLSSSSYLSSQPSIFSSSLLSYSSCLPHVNKVKTNPNNVFTCQTMKISNIGKLMTALKDILVETNMTIKPDGIRILNMDKSHTILVHLFLEAKNFDFYECKKDIIVIGLNMGQLYKLLQNVHQTDTLSIYIENSDYMDGIVSHLTLRSENSENNQCKTQKLKLIEAEFEDLDYPNDVRFSSIITLPSNDFQRIIRDLSAISDKVEIRTVGNELTFKASGHFAQSEILRTEKENSMTFKEKQESSKIIQGEFSLKNLSYFTRCTNLCPEVEIYLENDLPLVVQYKVASLGSIKLCVSTLPSNI